MVLKEAYRYMNHLNSLITEAELHLYEPAFTTKKKETHKKSAAISSEKDEVIENVNLYDVPFSVADVIDFIVEALNQKSLLSHAITEAKKNTPIDINDGISINKTTQEFINILNMLGKKKPSERTVKQVGYTFNAEGNQVPYKYDVDEVTSINYDRKVVKKLAKKLSSECDAVSTNLDAIEIETIVDYSPIWDLSDSLEDILTEE